MYSLNWYAGEKGRSPQREVVFKVDTWANCDVRVERPVVRRETRRKKREGCQLLVNLPEISVRMKPLQENRTSPEREKKTEWAVSERKRNVQELVPPVVWGKNICSDVSLSKCRNRGTKKTPDLE